MEIPFPMEPSNNNLSLLLDLSNQSINYITQAFEILIIMPTSSLFDIRNISNIVINRINQGELKIDKNITRLLNQLFRNMNKYKQFEPKTKVQRKEIYRLLYNKVNLPIIYQKIPFMKKPKKNTHSKSNDYLYMNTN